MKELKQVYEKYKEYQLQGYGDKESSQKALVDVYGHVSKPFVHDDCEGFPDHIFKDNHVLFFTDGKIYLLA